MKMAAHRAAEVYAYGESVRLLEQTIKVQQVLDPEDKAKLCDLWLDLCDALGFVPDGPRILQRRRRRPFHSPRASATACEPLEPAGRHWCRPWVPA